MQVLEFAKETDVRCANSSGIDATLQLADVSRKRVYVSVAGSPDLPTGRDHGNKIKQNNVNKPCEKKDWYFTLLSIRKKIFLLFMSSSTCPKLLFYH